jgi:hypothetical protein
MKIPKIRCTRINTLLPVLIKLLAFAFSTRSFVSIIYIGMLFVHFINLKYFIRVKLGILIIAASAFAGLLSRRMQ